jgi:hypothetical protein
MSTFPPHRVRHWVAHPLQPYRKGWVIERSETAVAYLRPTESSKVEVY